MKCSLKKRLKYLSTFKNAFCAWAENGTKLMWERQLMASNHIQKTSREETLKRPKCKWEDNIKMNLRYGSTSFHVFP
jgi:hypothetical protein